MRTRSVVVVGVVAAAVAMPLAFAAPRADVASRIPAVKRAEFDRAAVAPGLRVVKPRFVGATHEPSWRRGIVASGLAPFTESAYRIVNQWQDMVGGWHVNVYAGRLGSDARGVVVVQRTPLRTASPGPARAYVAAGAAGALRITRARGAVLELRSTGGERYLFDVRPGRSLLVSARHG
jgi:hypothetical protein